MVVWFYPTWNLKMLESMFVRLVMVLVEPSRRELHLSSNVSILENKLSIATNSSFLAPVQKVELQKVELQKVELQKVERQKVEGS